MEREKRLGPAPVTSVSTIASRRRGHGVVEQCDYQPGLSDGAAGLPSLHRHCRGSPARRVRGRLRRFGVEAVTQRVAWVQVGWTDPLFWRWFLVRMVMTTLPALL